MNRDRHRIEFDHRAELVANVQGTTVVHKCLWLICHFAGDDRQCRLRCLRLHRVFLGKENRKFPFCRLVQDESASLVTKQQAFEFKEFDSDQLDKRNVGRYVFGQPIGLEVFEPENGLIDGVGHVFDFGNK